MLSFLKISNLAILDDVSIELGAGLNVLTGETGAGKSIIVDAIGLLLGERGGSDLIRTGCEKLVVEGQFDLSARDDLEEVFTAAGLQDSDNAELVVRRELFMNEKGDKGGRSRAFLNGHLVTLATLRTLGEFLADLHGQHQHQSLLRTEGQRDALDRFAGTLAVRENISAIHARLKALGAEQHELEGRERERARLEDILKAQVAEIDAIGPKEDEDEALMREENLLRHASEVARLAGQSFALVSEDDDSVLSRLGTVEECAHRLSAIDPRASEVLAAIREARVAASEAARMLSAYAGRERNDEFDPSRLEQVAGRLAELDRLRRKYGASLRDVARFRGEALQQLEAIGGASARLEAIASERRTAHAAYMRLGAELSERRGRAAARLEKAVEKELKALAMEGTRVEIAVDQPEGAEPGPSGLDTIEFLIAPNRGEELRPLARIASGGELSRLMLAVRNAAQDGGADRRTLVFDEVDSGIGGRVGEAVGQRLAALGSGQQVLCVTHLPQIASFAQRHFRVSKKTAGQRTQAVVTRLDEEGRIDELARMLGGSPAETARRHAAALLGRPGRLPADALSGKERTRT